MAKRKTYEELEAERDAALQPLEFSAVTPLQQRLIEALLSGKSISESALIAGIERHTASRWLSQDNHPVKVEYERLRLVLLQKARERMAKLHDKALAALEAALSDEAPLSTRLDIAKYLLNQNAQSLNYERPSGTLELLRQERDQKSEKSLLSDNKSWLDLF